MSLTFKEALVKRVKAAIESGAQNLPLAVDVNSHTLLHAVAMCCLVDCWVSCVARWDWQMLSQ